MEQAATMAGRYRVGYAVFYISLKKDETKKCFRQPHFMLGMIKAVTVK